MSDSDDKTEAPSSQRLQKAREDGQIVMSREAMNFVALLGGFAGIFMVLPYLVTDFIHVMQVLMANAGTLPMTQGGLLHSTDHAIAAGLKLAVPMAASVAALCLGGGFLQTGFLIHPESLLPKFERISPLAGFKRIAGGGTLPDTFKALAKFTIFAVVLWNISKNVIPSVPRMVGLEPAPLLKIISDLGFKAASAMILAQLVIAGFDIFWMRFRHISKLKMSREDLKDEYKNTEGDPHVKGGRKDSDRGRHQSDALRRRTRLRERWRWCAQDRRKRHGRCRSPHQGHRTGQPHPACDQSALGSCAFHTSTRERNPS